MRNCDNCIHQCIILDKVVKLPNGGHKTTVPRDKPKLTCGRVSCEYKPRPTGKSSEPNSKSDEQQNR